MLPWLGCCRALRKHSEMKCTGISILATASTHEGPAESWVRRATDRMTPPSKQSKTTGLVAGVVNGRSISGYAGWPARCFFSSSSRTVALDCPSVITCASIGSGPPFASCVRVRRAALTFPCNISLVKRRIDCCSLSMPM